MVRYTSYPIPRINIVLLIVGTRGDVQPFIALGQALLAVGHRVRLATHETFRKFVRGNGLEFFPLAGDPAELMSFMVKNSGIIPSISSLAAGDLTKNRRILSEILVSTWSACTADDDETGQPFIAEVIIANPPSFGHIHCAQKLRIPLHIMFTMPWSPTTAFPHPLVNVDYSKAAIEKVNMLSYLAIEMFTWSSMRDLVNDFRKQTLALSALHTRQATSLMIDERVPYTYCWSPALVPKPNDWASHINVSGFFFLKQDATASKDQPKELVEFLGLTSNRSKKSLAAPIYIGFGSITGHDSERLLKIVVEALEKTGQRAVLSGLAKDEDQLPESIFKVGNVPHDWLFQHVFAVCHHGGAGTTAAGLRAGKPTIVVPFFGDQFFWGNVVEKNGAGPRPIPGKSLTTEDLVQSIEFVQQPSTRQAAERIRDAILKENGCDEAVRAFHAHLPLARMHSDLESSFVACFRLKPTHLQISRRVAQVLVLAGRIDLSQIQLHPIREWISMYDNRMHIPLHGILKHTHRGMVKMFNDMIEAIKQAKQSDDWKLGARYVLLGLCKGLGESLGHISIGCLSLYGEITDVLEVIPSYYDPYTEQELRSRPYISDFESGMNAALLALYRGWNDGIMDFLSTRRIACERHGQIGTVTGSLVAVANSIIKPLSGTLSSVTWFCRGVYASVHRFILDQNAEHLTAADTLGLDSTLLEKTEKNTTDDDSKDDMSEMLRIASEVTGFPSELCQNIVDEYDQAKKRGVRNHVHEHKL